MRSVPIITALALNAQRLKFPLPRAVRAPLRRLLHKMVQEESWDQDVEGWTTPLICRGTEVTGFPDQGNSEVLEVPQIRAMSDRHRSAKNLMRCLVVTSDLDAGGMDEVAALLVRRLPDHEIETCILHASNQGSENGNPSGRLGKRLLAEGVKVVELDEVRGARWIADWKPDVISAHGAPEWVLDAAARMKIPFIETLHGMHSLFNTNWLDEKRRSAKVTGMIAVSELVRRQYLKGNRDFASEKIVTIPNGVDDERRLPGDRQLARKRLGIQDEFLFVSLSRHCLQKNTYGLVAAFDELAARHPHVHLVIAGRPDDKVYFRQVCQLRDNLECRDRIHLRDHTSRPAELLAAADGFVLNSFFEGWSLASMEALFAGVPVVISDVGGAREQLGGDQRRGFLVPNPIGDALAVDWNMIRNSCFAKQANREQLVAAMDSLVKNQNHALAHRMWLMEDSRIRFQIDRCIRSHADILKASVKRRAFLMQL